MRCPRDISPYVLMGLVLSLCLSVSILAAVPATSNKSKKTTAIGKPWRVLYRGRRTRGGPRPIPKNASIQVLNNFELHGPRPGDPFLFGDFKSEAEWKIINGALRPTSGKNSALQLGRIEDFELEGVINAEGLGGWFILLGWDQEHGYMIYNVNLKKSGSPWLVCEFRGRKGLEETHREFHRFEWKGSQPFRLIVKEKQLSLLVGREVVADKLAMPAYHEGELILGAYDTRYGPKPLAIYSMRIRAR